jgi:hypothetical protein
VVGHSTARETEKPQVNWGFCWCPRVDLNLTHTRRCGAHGSIWLSGSRVSWSDWVTPARGLVVSLSGGGRVVLGSGGRSLPRW